jgi:hypothetical protein
VLGSTEHKTEQTPCKLPTLGIKMTSVLLKIVCSVDILKRFITINARKE